MSLARSDHAARSWLSWLLLVLLMLAVWLIMTWKLYEGMMEKKEYLETTFILAMPIWWA